MKKKIIFITILGLFFFSCSVQRVRTGILCGTFYTLNKDKNFSSSYTLELRPDSTFSFIIMVKDARPQCVGKWEQKKDTIFLRCNEEKDISVMLSNGYMNQRTFTIKVQNNNKLKFENIVLKRKN